MLSMSSQIVTGKTFTDSGLQNRVTSIVDIRSHMGPPPANWIESVDLKSLDLISGTRQMPLNEDRYLRLACDRD